MAAIDPYSNLGLYRSSQLDVYERHDTMDDSVMDDVRNAVDATPLTVAGLALGALVVLALLNRAGFRFSFGVSAGR